MLTVDASKTMKPGVYVLRQGRRVVWVGRARNMLLRIAAHLDQRRGDFPLPGLPRAPIAFDGIECRPCLIDHLESLHAQTCLELRWHAPELKLAS